MWVVAPRYHGGTRLSPASARGAPLQVASGRVAFTPVEAWLRDFKRASGAPRGAAEALYGTQAQKGKGKKGESKTWEPGDAVAGSAWKRPLDRSKQPAWHSLGITYGNLPRAAVIVFSVQTNSGYLGWAGFHLFQQDRTLRTGKVELKLWRGKPNPIAMQLENQFGTGCGGIVGTLTVEMPTFDRPVAITDHVDADLARAAAAARDKHQSVDTRLPPFLDREPTYRLTADNKRWIWAHRNSVAVKQCPQALPMLLKAVNWGSAKDVQEAYRLLNDWDAIDADVALQLLDKTFPDPKARKMKLRRDRSDRVDQIGGS